MSYHIFYSTKAINVLVSVVDYIEQNLFAPITAERFYRGMIRRINSLIYSGNCYQIIYNIYHQNLRKINYKDWTNYLYNK